MSKIIRVAISIVLIITMTAVPVMADIDRLLDDIVGGTYAQEPGVYKSPTTTTYSLGSASFRLKNDLLGRPMFSFQPPRATISCSGMDFDAGMISMLNLDQFEKMLTQAGASLAWGIMIGLAYSLPGIKASYDSLQEYARQAQQLFQQPCNIGKMLGSSIGEKIFDNTAKGKVEEGVKSGASSNFSEGMKKVLQQLKYNDFYQTLPYSVLTRAGLTDTELQNLIASWFGVIDIYLADSGGNKITYNPGAGCGDECSSNNIKISFLPPKIDTLEMILNGGSSELYSCGSPSPDGQVCASIPPLPKSNISGLRNKIVVKLQAVINQFAGKGGLDSLTNDADTVKAMTRIIPQLSGIVGYASIMKRQGHSNVSASIVGVMSERIALSLLYDTIQQIDGYLSAAVSTSTTKIPEQVLKNYIEHTGKAKTVLIDKLKDSNERYQAIEQSYQNFLAVKSISDKAMEGHFGKGVNLGL